MSTWRRSHRRPDAGAKRSTRVGTTFFVLVVLSLATSACSTATTSRAPAPAKAEARVGRSAVTAAVAPTTTTTTDPGTLPQTTAQPPSDNASLQTALAPLWAGMVSGSVPTAVATFFPEAAYLQMKTGQIPDPSGDYQSRLLGFFGLDLAAYHQTLGADAAHAALLAVEANPADAVWIPPGSCENSIGYWHLPGVRLVYQVAGATQSFAVASLISWRGVWYVVHLGPNPRPLDVGTVDQSAFGPGTPGPAGGC